MRIFGKPKFLPRFPTGRARSDDQFWTELLGKKDKPSMEKNLKELGF
jgi:hypothetical protein